MLLPPSLTVIAEYVWEIRTEMTLSDKDANLQQTCFPCVLPKTSSFYQNILQFHGIMGQLKVHNNSFRKKFLSYMVFFSFTRKRPTCFCSGSQLPSSQVQKIPSYRQLFVAEGSCIIFSDVDFRAIQIYILRELKKLRLYFSPPSNPNTSDSQR